MYSCSPCACLTFSPVCLLQAFIFRIHTSISFACWHLILQATLVMEAVFCISLPTPFWHLLALKKERIEGVWRGGEEKGFCCFFHFLLGTNQKRPSICQKQICQIKFNWFSCYFHAWFIHTHIYKLLFLRTGLLSSKTWNVVFQTNRRFLLKGKYGYQLVSISTPIKPSDFGRAFSPPSQMGGRIDAEVLIHNSNCLPQFYLVSGMVLPLPKLLKNLVSS